MSNDYYTWKTFVEAVKGMLTVDANRANTGGYLTAQIRQGVIRLQSVVDEFRCGHETIYFPGDMVVEGCASRGVKPPQSVIRDVWLCKLNSAGTGVMKYRCGDCDWANRFSLVAGQHCVNGEQPVFSMDPYGYTFYVYPEVADCWRLSMHWDGLKLDFQDEEETPFTEMMAGAVALFVKAKFAREVEKNVTLSKDYMDEFKGMKPLLHANAKEKSQKKG